jgi:hypothetical protein
LLISNAGSSTETQNPPSPPTTPNPITLAPFDPELDPQKQVDVYTQQVNAYTQAVTAYTQQVSAYTQEVDAYKTFGELSDNSRQTALYQLVVKDTLLSIFNSFLTALLAYAFVRGAASVINNYNLVSQGQPAEPLKFF